MNKIIQTYIHIAGATALLNAQTPQPNILYVFPDQMRNTAMEFWQEKPFSEKIRTQADPVFTPNLNKFAAESVVLSNALSNCPLSSPHRGMMLTGMYPDGSGVSLNCNSNRPNSSLREDAVTISDILSQNGYDCGYIGKLHVDFPTKNNPQNPGTYVENRIPAWDAFTPREKRHGFRYWYSYGTFDDHKNPHYWDSEDRRHEIREWSPKHEADKAIQFIQSDRDKSKPFFLMVSMNPPHHPYHSPDDVEAQDYELYKEKKLTELLVRPNVNPNLIEKQQTAPFYFSAITGVDREFGRILKALKDSGLEKNTIVVFTSDHGETLASHLEDPKNSPYAEAFDVPFIIRYPKVLKPGVNSLLLGTPDIMPTLLTLAGLKNKIPATVQGDDLSGFLLGKLKSAPTAQLYIQNMDGDKDKDGSVMNYFPRSRGLKTHQYTMALQIDRTYKLKSVLLFDDNKDPYQMNPLNIENNQGLYQDLLNQLAILLKKADDVWYKRKILSDLISYPVN